MILFFIDFEFFFKNFRFHYLYLKNVNLNRKIFLKKIR
jgi:hypothetical protein